MQWKHIHAPHQLVRVPCASDASVQPELPTPGCWSHAAVIWHEIVTQSRGISFVPLTILRSADISHSVCTSLTLWHWLNKPLQLGRLGTAWRNERSIKSTKIVYPSSSVFAQTSFGSSSYRPMHAANTKVGLVSRARKSSRWIITKFVTYERYKRWLWGCRPQEIIVFQVHKTTKRSIDWLIDVHFTLSKAICRNIKLQHLK
jgi:hypothetical protein